MTNPAPEAAATPKVTYTAMATSPELRQRFDAALAAVRERLGGLWGGSAAEDSLSAALDDVRSPIDTSWLVARVVRSSPFEVASAVGRAEGAFEAWRHVDWQRRVAILRAAADRISARALELAAWMVFEVGKTRLEAMAEVEESADLLRYYAAQLEANDGYRRPMGRMAPSEATESVFLPYGVWGAIAPFNFPSALAAGMMGAALVTGNTVVFKPAAETPVSGARLVEELWAAGVPRDALQLVLGPAQTGAALVEDPRLAGLAFTGSFDVGMRLLRGMPNPWPRPMVLEMGGKNATVVTAAADLDSAAQAVARSAYGFGGQKCSACSRVYVVEEVAAPFLERLVERTRAATVGDPTAPGDDPSLGPLIRPRAVEAFERYVAGIRAAGGEVLAGGAVLRDEAHARGHYVQPTLARMPDRHHPYFGEEMFLPLLLVATATDLDDAIAEANRSPFGLTAGIFSRDAAEVSRFLDRIEAGVVYVNRRSGSTTGAWPGINPFGGWKGSGAGGPAALGPHYLLKFLREQSRTINDVEV
jgi:1-pyrroline-5-carboxylate dehydrogenase